MTKPLIAAGDDRSNMRDIDYMPGWTEIGVTYRELVEMSSAQFRLLQLTAEHCRREELPAEDAIDQMKWALNRPTN